MAPLFTKFRADISAGGARRDLALTRMATGSMLMFTMADMALSGHVTGGGPANKEQKDALYRSGWQPYSVVGVIGLIAILYKLLPLAGI